MKSISKRILCILTSLMMLLPLMCVGVSAEVPTTYVFDANNITVNSTHTEILGLPDYISARPEAGNAAAKPKAYKQTGILGFTDEESVLELIAREERANRGNFYIKDLSFEADSDFYVTTKVYIKDAREMDALRIYATISDSDSASSSISMFLYNGHSYRNLSSLHNQEGIDYVNDNWYNFTMALTKNADDNTKYDVNYYLDNKALHGMNSTLNKNITLNTIGNNITIESFGIGFGYVSGTTDFGGIPQWCAIKDMKIVKGTFNKDNFDTTVSSSAYTVAATSVASSGVGTSVTGVPVTTVSEFLGNITVPTGATKKVVKIAEDNLATTVMGNDAVVTSDMKLLVTSTNGAMKLYDIDAAVDASLLPVISSNANYPAYVVDADAKKISIPDTTAAKLKERITLGEGTTVKVVDANGYEVADNKAVTNTMKLVATKGVDVSYDLEITKNYGFHGDLTTTADTTLFSSTYTTAWSTTNGFFSPYSGSAANKRGEPSAINKGVTVTPEENATYTVTTATIPNTSIPAYKTSFSGYDGWWYHESLGSKYCDEVQHRAFTDDTKLEGEYDHLVTETNMLLEQGAGAEITIRHAGKVGTEGYDYNLKTYTVAFEDGHIYLNPALRSSTYATGTEIGTYTEGTPFKIAIVEDKKVNGNQIGDQGVMNLKGIYVNDVKIFPLESAGHNANVASSSTVYYGAFQSFIMASKGTVYWGKIDIFATDNYALPEAAAAEADLSITSDDVTITGDRIYGWESTRTVADLKAAINSAATTEVEVLNIIGSAALAENVALENGMLFRVTDKNHPENTAYYVLAKTTTDSGTTVTVAGDKVTATRQVLVYTAESSPKSLTVILAVYEGDTLVSAKLDTKTIQAIGDYDFEVEIEGYNPATMTYKAFAWNLGTLVPYEGITD